MTKGDILKEVMGVLTSVEGNLTIYTLYGSPANSTTEIVGAWPRDLHLLSVRSFMSLIDDYTANSGYKHTEIQKQSDPGWNLLIVSTEWEDGTVYQLNIT